MDNNFYVNLAESMKKYSSSQRQHLIAGYVYDTFDDDALTKMPAVFFAELLKNEEDDICKWYEIKAIGKLKAIEYGDTLVSILTDDDVKFETGSSLHLITAKSLGLMGEVVVSKVLALWNNANVQTRLAIIDTLGETKCSVAANKLGDMLPSLNLNEFAYATLALSKCGTDGQEILKKILSDYSQQERAFCIIDALCYSSENDAFLKEILNAESDLIINVLKTKTRGACILLNRINNCEEIWTEDDKALMLQKGVNFNE